MSGWSQILLTVSTEPWTLEMAMSTIQVIAS